MNFRNKLVAVVGSTLLLASSITMGSAADQLEDDATASVTITGGAITVMLTGGEFEDTSYSLSEQTVTEESLLTARVDDLRGTAGGWDVSLKADPFAPATGTNATSFPSTNLWLDAHQPAKADIAQTAATIEGQTWNSINVSDSAQMIWEANDLYGAGSFTMAMNGTLNIPAGTLVGGYNSKVTVSLVAGP